MASTFPTDQTAITTLDSGDTLLVADSSDSNNAKKIDRTKLLAPVPDSGGGGINLCANADSNSINSASHTCVILSGTNTHIGQQTHTNRGTDTSVSPFTGVANHSIVGGYDCQINGVASVNLAFHTKILEAATHGAIVGGSYHSITAGDYNAILGGGGGSVGTASSIDGEGCGIVAGAANDITGSPNQAGILAGNSNTVSANYAAAVGGLSNTVSGIQSAAIGGTNATVSNTNAVTIGGSGLTASGAGAVAIGGSGNSGVSTGIASGLNSAVIGGSGNTASGIGAVVLGGQGTNTASANACIVSGRDCTATDEEYQAVFGYSAAGKTTSTLTVGSQAIASAGDAQTIRFTVRGQTTNEWSARHQRKLLPASRP